MKLLNANRTKNAKQRLAPECYSPLFVNATLYLIRDRIDTVLYISYENAVHVNMNSPYSGTDVPVGNVEHPVNNMEDARKIAEIMGFNTIVVKI